MRAKCLMLAQLKLSIVEEYYFEIYVASLKEIVRKLHEDTIRGIWKNLC